VTRLCGGLAKATLVTTSPLYFTEAKLAAFRRVEAKARMSRYGGDCYAFAMLAAGHVDCVIESASRPMTSPPEADHRWRWRVVTNWEEETDGRRRHRRLLRPEAS